MTTSTPVPVELLSPPTRKRGLRLAQRIRKAGTMKLFASAVGITVVVVILLIILFNLAVRNVSWIVSDQDALSIEGVMSLLAVAVVIGGGLFALSEYVEAEEQRSFSLYTSLIERLMDPEEIKIRRWIISNIEVLTTSMDRDRWIEDVREKLFRGDDPEGPRIGSIYVKQVLNTFDYLGFVALNYWELDSELMAWLNPMVTKVWDRIWPYIEEEADRRAEPEYYIWAREFCYQCALWRQEHDRAPSKRVSDAL